ncbi:hypothetical protein FRC02_008652 [Tulasnella sp. 418]|nr:hypothetical protein FRC02_008652 [Tulasnella sp. 418]
MPRSNHKWDMSMMGNMTTITNIPNIPANIPNIPEAAITSLNLSQEWSMYNNLKGGTMTAEVVLRAALALPDVAQQHFAVVLAGYASCTPFICLVYLCIMLV